jgi:hypothetical protein
VLEKFAEKFPETPVPHRNGLRRLTEKFRETGSLLDAERSSDARGHHFQQFCKCTMTFRKHSTTCQLEKWVNIGQKEETCYSHMVTHRSKRECIL